MIYVPQSSEEVVAVSSVTYYSRKLSKCQKAAFVDGLEQVEKVKLQLNIDTKQITKSKSPYTNQYDNWTFLDNSWSVSVTLSRLKNLFQSGIITLWRSWKFRLDTWNDTVASVRQESTKFKALSTSDSSLVVVFYLHAIILALTIVVAFIEARIKIAKFWKT